MKKTRFAVAGAIAALLVVATAAPAHAEAFSGAYNCGSRHVKITASAPEYVSATAGGNTRVSDGSGTRTVSATSPEPGLSSWSAASKYPYKVTYSLSCVQVS